MQLTETAAQRYSGLVTMLAPTLHPELSKAALQDVIERANGNAAPALASHIAAKTPFTVEEVEPKVTAALASAGDAAGPAAKAEATQQVVASLPKLNLELSEAVMLNGTVRTVFAAIFTFIFVGGISTIVGVGTEAHPSETALVALVVVTVLALIVTLVLVMGYKTVKAKVEPAGA
jgi:hypothetical protein